MTITLDRAIDAAWIATCRNLAGNELVSKKSDPDAAESTTTLRQEIGKILRVASVAVILVFPDGRHVDSSDTGVPLRDLFTGASAMAIPVYWPMQFP